MDKIVAFYQFLQTHPMYWQAPLAAIATSGAFEWIKHKLALEGKKKITSLLSLLALLEVMVHMAIIGVTVPGLTALFKISAQQSLMFLGILNLIYNFLTHPVAKLLADAKAAAASGTASATPPQINQGANTSAAESGVATL